MDQEHLSTPKPAFPSFSERSNKQIGTWLQFFLFINKISNCIQPELSGFKQSETVAFHQCVLLGDVGECSLSCHFEVRFNSTSSWLVI